MLETNVCGIKMKSPVMLGSGTLGERKESLIRALNQGAGAVVNRTLRLDNTKRKTFKPAHYVERSFMLNADNNNATPWKYWIENAAEVERHGPLVVSISARNPDDAKTIVPAIEASHVPSAYELNFSCSHSAKLYGRISYADVEKALRNIRASSKKPVFLKLSIDDMNFDELKRLEQLFDAYVLSNTIGPGLKIDINTRKPVLGSVFGGVSGAAIKPLVLAKIHELRNHTKKPIIGVGGIENAVDVLEYLILGCDAVQVYTVAHRVGPVIFTKINRDLEHLLNQMGETVESIKGTLKT